MSSSINSRILPLIYNRVPSQQFCILHKKLAAQNFQRLWQIKNSMEYCMTFRTYWIKSIIKGRLYNGSSGPRVGRWTWCFSKAPLLSSLQESMFPCASPSSRLEMSFPYERALGLTTMVLSGSDFALVRSNACRNVCPRVMRPERHHSTFGKVFSAAQIGEYSYSELLSPWTAPWNFWMLSIPAAGSSNVRQSTIFFKEWVFFVDDRSYGSCTLVSCLCNPCPTVIHKLLFI